MAASHGAGTLKSTSINGVKLYSLTGSRYVAPWVVAKKKRALRKDKEYQRRLDLIHDLRFETATTKIKLTPDDQYVIASGIYPPQVKVYELKELSMKFERHMISEIVTFQLKELDALAKLPNLVQLRLRENAFNAENIVFRRYAFPKLRILLIKGYGMAMSGVTFEQSTTPNMEIIEIENCTLRSGIYDIKKLPKLKRIYIMKCDLGKQDMRKEVKNHTNHPVLHMSDVF